jgi:hypothetical protein
VPRQGVSLLKASAEGLLTFSLPAVSWEVRPDPEDAGERATLVAAVERALAEEAESAWWRSGLDDLGGGPAPEEPWAQPGESGGG